MIHAYFIGTPTAEYLMTFNYVKNSKHNTRSVLSQQNVYCKQIIDDSVHLLERRQEAYIFNNAQLMAVQERCDSAKIELTIYKTDDYILLTRRN